MMNIFAALGVAMMASACSPQHSPDLAFPMGQLTTTVGDPADTEEDSLVIFCVGKLPIVLATDFIPG